MVKRINRFLPQPIQDKQLDQEHQVSIFERQQIELAYECETLKKVHDGKELDILNNENWDICNDLYVATGGPKKLIDRRTNAHLNNLLGRYNNYKKELNDRRLNHKEIDQQICLMKSKVLLTQSKVCTDVQYQNRVMEGRKTLEKLENKLETVIKTWCTINDENSMLRDEINHYLQERVSFHELWNKKIEHLRHGKKVMLDLIEQATIAYNKRDQAVAMLNALREKSWSDYVLHSQEMEEHQCQKNQKTKLRTFIKHKNLRRLMCDLLQTKTQKVENKHLERTKKLKKNQKTLDIIWNFAGTKSLKDFVQMFSNVEIDNYNHFIFTLTIKVQILSLTDDIVDLEERITQKLRLRSLQTKNEKQVISSLQTQLKTNAFVIDAIEKDQVRLETTLKKLFQEIYKLFTLCKGNATQFLNLLGDNATVNQYNVFLFLNTLDEQINTLLLLTYHSQSIKQVSKNKIMFRLINDRLGFYKIKPLHKIVTKTPCPLCLESEEVHGFIDVLQFVSNKDETRQRLKTLLKLPNALDKMHNVSACRLRKSRAIVQKRY